MEIFIILFYLDNIYNSINIFDNNHFNINKN